MLFFLLPELPVTQGLAGLFGGVSHGMLLVAGGSNFPEKRPWDGGTKTWYPQIYGLSSPHGKWRKLGLLPMPLGYGVSVTYKNRVICIGGSDKNGFHSDVFSLEWRHGRIVTRSLPSLPIPLSLSFGGRLGDEVIVGGGQTRPDGPASSAFFALNLSSRDLHWRKLKSAPTPGRILAAAGVFHRQFWFGGGASLDHSQKRTYLTDVYSFDFLHGWKRRPDLAHKTLGAPFLAGVILGGDDGSKLGFKPPEKHPGFSRWIQTYLNGRWISQPSLPFSAVLMPAIRWRGMWVLPGGESIPGVRSRAVWAVKR